VGNSNALVLDRAVMDLVGLAESDDVQLTVHDGTLIVTPVRPKAITREDVEGALDRVVARRRSALKRLAQ